ncbi:hypothetical protein [Sulfurimonas sp. HSL3-2]
MQKSSCHGWISSRLSSVVTAKNQKLGQALKQFDFPTLPLGQKS